MLEIKDLIFTSETVANMVEANLNTVTVKLKPQTREQWSKNLSNLFNRESANSLRDELIKLGFLFKWTSSLTGDEYYHQLHKGVVVVQIHFLNTITKEEKCAKLKAELAEMGCYY